MKEQIKIVSVVGARPNFMKIAPIARAMEDHNRQGNQPEIASLIVHTGQHYDEKMSKLFFDDLGIPKPDYNLEVGSGSHAYQTAEIMKRFEPVLQDEAPDYILVVGDVNSTIACALVAKKLGIQVIHVEAGLRSFDRTMPEEINRILTDAISDVLFITEPSAEKNLRAEGIPEDKIHFVGNVMIDTLLQHKAKAEKSAVLQDLGLTENSGSSIRPYAVLTLHRPSNVDNHAILFDILSAASEISDRITVVFPVHPRTLSQIKETKIRLSAQVKLIDPLGYLDFMKLVSHARFVMSDSGGIQEETTVLGVPCLTLRMNTERPVTVEQGTNIMVGVDKSRILDEGLKIIDSSPRKGSRPELWDGNAAQRMVKILRRRNLV
ncbi:MAG: UDP-N-acetylglucosamine 2-epimerase (non-hydrolyzing) [bacterium]|nr:UDP-N-acetylglucosamine 2-epimerase (non-hydrolyzing) [bacterium]